MDELANVEPSPSNHSSSNTRNNQQHGEEGSNLLTIGTTNITDSHLNQVTNVEHLDNMNVENLQQNIHQDVHQNIHQEFHQEINQNVLLNLQQDVHIQQTLHQYFQTEMTINASQNEEEFDEERFQEYFTQMECTYADMFEQGRPITQDMYEHTPVVLQTSFNELNTKKIQQPQQQGTTKIADVFPIEDVTSNKRLVAIIGEPGAGKTVYLHTLRPYYIQRGFYPFLFDFKNLASITEHIKLFELLKGACPDFRFNDSKSFETWVEKSEKKIVLLLDGLDQAPFLIKNNVPPTNIQSFASVATWISLLVSNKIMKKSKVIVTSRPSSVTNLSLSHRPNIIYTLNGFSDDSLDRVVRSYKSEHTKEIIRFISSKGSNVVSYARNPFVISLISLIYKSSMSYAITAETTMTEIYRIAFEELSLSVHNQKKENETEAENKEIAAKVDKFYYDKFIEMKWSFTVEDINKYGLELQQFENQGWISVSSRRSSNSIAPRDKIIAPHHQSLMEYHVSRHIMDMNVKDFKHVIQQMYELHDQDRWMMIRRFLSGHINTGLFGEEKRKVFLRKFVEKLKEFTTEDLVLKYDDIWKHGQAFLLQGFLFNDMVELRNQLKFIKEEFTGTSPINFNVQVTDIASIEGPVYFLQNVDPHLQQLKIVFPGELTFDNFSRISTAVEKLSKKVNFMHLSYITFNTGVVDELKRIIPKVDQVLTLNYRTYVAAGEIEIVKTQIQRHIDEYEFTKTQVVVKHGNRNHLMRHHSYTSMTSSLILPSNLDEKRKTINLVKLGKEKTFTRVANASRYYLLDSDVCDENELKILTELLINVKLSNIGYIIIYLSSDIRWKYFQMFCKTINKMETKVQHIAVYNFKTSKANMELIPLLTIKVEYSLGLYCLGGTNETELNELINNIEQQITSPNVEVIIRFTNFGVTRSARTHKWTVTPFNSGHEVNSTNLK